MSRPSTSSKSASSAKHQPQLRFCQRTTNVEKFSILLIGTPVFCNSMQECVFDTFKHMYKTEAIVSIAESVESILDSSRELHVDFVVFLMHTGRRQSLEQVERDICLLDPIYLCDKAILVDGCNHLSPAYLGVSYDELFSISQKYHLQVIHGNIEDENSRKILAKRIINFSTVTCGLKTGMPGILHFPTDKFPVY